MWGAVGGGRWVGGGLVVWCGLAVKVSRICSVCPDLRDLC